MRILNRLPLWTLLLIFVPIILFSVRKYSTSLSSNEVDLISAILTLMGLLFVAVQLQKQWKHDKINTIYLNQPDFTFSAFWPTQLDEEESFGIKMGTPTLCPQENICTDDHWFVIKQTGKIPALRMKMALIHVNEKNNIILLDKRWISDSYLLYEGHLASYKLPQKSIPTDFFKRNIYGHFHILLEYETAYMHEKFKRIYSLSYIGVNKDKISDWKDMIRYVGVSLDGYNSKSQQTFSEVIKNQFVNAKYRFIKRKSQSLHEWLNEF